MGRKKKIPVKHTSTLKMLQAMREHEGVVRLAAVMLDIPPTEIYQRAAVCEELREMIRRPSNGGKMIYTSEMIVQALEQTGGQVVEAASLLGCHANLVYQRAKQCPEVKAEWLRSREELTDTAEVKLKDLVKSGDRQSVFFVLETIGKKRGYVKRTTNVIRGQKDAPPIKVQSEPFPFDELPLALREQILECMERKQREKEGGEQAQLPVPAQELQQPSNGLPAEQQT